MGKLTKVVAVAACAFLVQAGAAMADPATQPNSDHTPKASDNECPKGMVEGPDGVCVQSKKGRMGFDLAAPGDDSSSSSSNSNNSRSVSGKHGHH